LSLVLRQLPLARETRSTFTLPEPVSHGRWPESLKLVNGSPRSTYPSRTISATYRADTPGRCDGGAGLGLSIAKWIVEQYRGEIVVESAPSMGSLFRVKPPVRSQAGPQWAARRTVL